MAADLRHRVRDHDGRQARAAVEEAVRDPGDARIEGHAGQRFTAVKSTPAFFQRGRNIRRCEGSAVVEYVAFQRNQPLRKLDGRQGRAVSEAILFNGRQEIAQPDGDQGRAGVKRIAADLRHRVRELDSRQARAVIEEAVRDAGDALAEGHIGERFAVLKSTPAFLQGGGDMDRSQRRAVPEGIAHGNKPLRKLDGRQGRAAAERAGPQLRKALGKEYGGKRRTAYEGIAFDDRQVFAQLQGGQRRAAVKGMAADLRHRVRDRDGRQARAAVKEAVRDPGDAGPEGHAGQRFAAIKGIPAILQGGRDMDRRQGRAAVEYVAFQRDQPLRKLDGRQGRAVSESILTYGRQVFAQLQGGQGRAAVKRPFSDLRHRVRDRDGCQARAAVEEAVWDPGDVLPKGHVGQAAAVSEGIIACLQGGRDIDRRQRLTALKSVVSQGDQPLRERGDRQGRAVSESMLTYGRQVFAQLQGGQGRAAVKRPFSDLRHRVRDRDGRQARAAVEEAVRDPGDARPEGHAGQAAAVSEGIIACLQGGRNIDRRQRLAALKSVVSQSDQTLREHGGRQGRAVVKGKAADPRHRVRDHNLRQQVVVAEGVIADFRHRLAVDGLRDGNGGVAAQVAGDGQRSVRQLRGIPVGGLYGKGDLRAALLPLRSHCAAGHEHQQNQQQCRYFQCFHRLSSVRRFYCFLLFKNIQHLHSEYKRNFNGGSPSRKTDRSAGRQPPRTRCPHRRFALIRGFLFRRNLIYLYLHHIREAGSWTETRSSAPYRSRTCASSACR